MRYNLLVPPGERFIPPEKFQKYYLFADVVKDVLSKLDKEINGDGQQKQSLQPQKYLLINQLSTLCL